MHSYTVSVMSIDIAIDITKILAYFADLTCMDNCAYYACIITNYLII